MKLNYQESNTVEFKRTIDVDSLKREISAMSNSVSNEDAKHVTCKIFLFVDDEGNTLENFSISKSDLKKIEELKAWLHSMDIENEFTNDNENNFLLVEFKPKSNYVIIINDNEIYHRVGTCTRKVDIHGAKAIYTSKEIELPLRTNHKYNSIHFKDLESQLIKHYQTNLTIDWMYSHQLINDKNSKYLTTYGLWLGDNSTRKIIINDIEYQGSVFKLYDDFQNAIKPWLALEPIVDKKYSTRVPNKHSVSKIVLREIFFNAIAHSAIYIDHYCIISFDDEKITFKNTHIYNKKVLKAFNSNIIPPTAPSNQIWFDAIRNVKLVEGSNYGFKEIRKDAMEKGYMIAIKYDSDIFELNLITAESSKEIYRKKGKYTIWEK